MLAFGHSPNLNCRRSVSTEGLGCRGGKFFGSAAASDEAFFLPIAARPFRSKNFALLFATAAALFLASVSVATWKRSEASNNVHLSRNLSTDSARASGGSSGLNPSRQPRSRATDFAADCRVISASSSIASSKCGTEATFLEFPKPAAATARTSGV